MEEENLSIVACPRYHEEGSNSGAVATQFDETGTQFPDQALECGRVSLQSHGVPSARHS